MKKTHIKHVIITRMDHDPDDPKMKAMLDKRLVLYKKWVLPCLKAQTNQNFDIAILCDPKNEKLFKDMGLKTFYTRDGYKGTDVYTSSNTGNICNSYNGRYENMVGLDKYEIQTNLFSDDIIGKDFVDKTQKAVENIKVPTHVNCQPKLKDLRTGLEKEMGLKYSDKYGSTIFSIYQPEGTEPYYYVYHNDHDKMVNLFENKIFVDLECWMGIHDDNMDTTMNC